MSVQEYATPTGYYDRPYTHDFDVSTLLASRSSNSLFPGNVKRVALSADFFILRSIVFCACNPAMIVTSPTDPHAPGFNFKDGLGRYRFRDYRCVAPYNALKQQLGVVPLAPEIAYPRSSSIGFDINGLVQNWNGYTGGTTVGTNSVPCGRIYFRGVNRWRGTDPTMPDLSGRVSEPYTYTQTINVNWLYWVGNLAANGLTSNNRYLITVTGWHFELLDICVIGDYWSGGNFSGGTARIQLYDSGFNPVSENPVSLSLNSLNQSTPTAQQQGTIQGAGAVCPSLWYPDQSVIQFDLQSLLNSSDISSQSVTILFRGRRWYKRQGKGAA